MLWSAQASVRRRSIAILVAVVATALIATAPTPAGLDRAAQLALATMALAAILWVTKALPLAVTALLIPVVLTIFGIYDQMETALSGGRTGRELIEPFLDDLPRALASDGVALLLVSSLTGFADVVEYAVDRGLRAETVAEESYPFETLSILALRHRVRAE